jgi:hypothetical protein
VGLDARMITAERGEWLGAVPRVESVHIHPEVYFTQRHASRATSASNRSKFLAVSNRTSLWLWSGLPV